MTHRYNGKFFPTPTGFAPNFLTVKRSTTSSNNYTFQFVLFSLRSQHLILLCPALKWNFFEAICCYFEASIYLFHFFLIRLMFCLHWRLNLSPKFWTSLNILQRVVWRWLGLIKEMPLKVFSSFNFKNHYFLILEYISLK